MALPTRYGSAFLAGTKGETFATGYDINSSGVVNGGTIVKAGNKASDSPVTNSLSVATLADDQGTSFGSKVVTNDGSAGDKVGVSGAIQAGFVDGASVVFNAGATNWIMRGGNVTTSLNGVANTQLIGGARDYAGNLNDFDTEANRIRITERQVGEYASRDINVMARPSTAINPILENRGSNAGSEFTFVNPADGTPAVRSEIAPSQAVPGELTYFFGALAQPTTDDYKAKNSQES